MFKYAKCYKIAKQINIKGALDKSNIYLFISSSVKDCKSNLYRKFQLILPPGFCQCVFIL